MNALGPIFAIRTKLVDATRASDATSEAPKVEGTTATASTNSAPALVGAANTMLSVEAM
jgi:hypothetical protein